MGENDVLQQRMSTFEKFMEKQEESNKRMWERIDYQSKEMVRIQALMEGISKTLDEVKVALNGLSGKETSKWEQFYSKAFWGLAGAIVSFLVYKFSGH